MTHQGGPDPELCSPPGIRRPQAGPRRPGRSKGPSARSTWACCSRIVARSIAGRQVLGLRLRARRTPPRTGARGRRPGHGRFSPRSRNGRPRAPLHLRTRSTRRPREIGFERSRSVRWPRSRRAEAVRVADPWLVRESNEGGGSRGRCPWTRWPRSRRSTDRVFRPHRWTAISPQSKRPVAPSAPARHPCAVA